MFNICMKEAIRTKEKCPKCKGKFEDTGKALVCSSCLTMPVKYYIDIYWQGKHKIYSDKDGRTLSSYELASRVLAEIRQAIDKKSFDLKDVQEVIFDKIPDRHKPIFTFIKETGCRPGEARAIWKEDINLKEKTAIIGRSFSDNEYREFTKTKVQRVIPLSDEPVKTLKSLSVISLNPRSNLN